MPPKRKTASPKNSTASIGKTVDDAMAAIKRAGKCANAEARMWN